MALEKEELVRLVTLAQNGDTDALNELFNHFYNDLYYFALKTVKDEDLALDITQEAFVEIINTLSSLKEPAAFVTWAKQITYHQCTRYFKKKKDILVDENEEGGSVFDTLTEENAEFIPDKALDQNDFRKTILSILDELSEEQRAATMMYYFDEMSVKEIAEIQGVSEGTVKSRLNYARKTIKQSVEEYEKKNGIKLHALPFFPLFKWIFAGAFEGGLSLGSADVIAKGVAAATGSSVAATATAVTASTATAAATTTAASAGIGAKLVALPVATKIIAGITAATIAVGSATTAAVIISNNNSENDKNSSKPTISAVEEMVLEGIIPKGCVYTLYDGTVLTEGQPFPEKCTAGDHVEYGDYLYGYEAIYMPEENDENPWCLWDDYFDPIDSGMKDSDVYETWSVRVKDNTKERYGTILSSINGVAVKNLYATFFECKNLKVAPKIPKTVTAMTATFYGCESLKTAPALPRNVCRIMLTFAGCTALSGDVTLNVTLDKSYEWLYSDTFTGTVNAINLKGCTPEEDLILIAKASDNQKITVLGKAVDYSGVFGDQANPNQDIFGQLPSFDQLSNIKPAEVFWLVFFNMNDPEKYIVVDTDTYTEFRIPAQDIKAISNAYFGQDIFTESFKSDYSNADYFVTYSGDYFSVYFEK